MNQDNFGTLYILILFYLFYPLKLDQLFSIEINFVFVQFFNSNNGALETKTYFMYSYGLKNVFLCHLFYAPLTKQKGREQNSHCQIIELFVYT